MSKIDESIKKMEETIEDVKVFANEKMEGLDEPTREKIQKLTDATTKVITQAKAKVEEVAQSVQDDEKLNAFLNNVMIRVQEASDYTKTKISALLPEREKLEDIERQISDSFDNFVDSENVQSVIKAFQKVTDNVQDYINKPETQDRIKKAKKATLVACEKGMEKLREILATEDDDEKEKIIIEDDDQDLK